MKIIEKLTLVIYSYVVLIISLICFLLLLNWTNIEMISTVMNNVLQNDTYRNILLLVSIIFTILSIRCIFFLGKTDDENKNGIMLENESGKLLISKNTIANLVESVASGFETIKSSETKVIFDENNNVKINLTLMVSPNTVMRELSTNLQNRIKEVVKRATDLEIQEININIKNISEKQQEAQ